MINVGDVVLSEVCGISKYGFFVKIKNGINGLVHISEVSNDFVKNIEEFVHIGDKIFCEVLEVLDNGSKLRLSIKNINYRLIDKYDDNSFKDAGFKILKEQLPLWIEEKVKERD